MTFRPCPSSSGVLLGTADVAFTMPTIVSDEVHVAATDAILIGTTGEPAVSVTPPIPVGEAHLAVDDAPGVYLLYWTFELTPGANTVQVDVSQFFFSTSTNHGLVVLGKHDTASGIFPSLPFTITSETGVSVDAHLTCSGGVNREWGFLVAQLTVLRFALP